ncbi:hypothetical protein CTheo_1091 [Ceratobasidium theobromae]|uniref:Glycoside hydrolase 131 catalytic N-terminal domain-containing protein n=1 Tax=Ceratobasidium theobromae TaxID=1582974 RepID=A0A5N5QUR2_9AGAM|nr:hypothetical protein CTheo_1091 [Ceratobasidium theobromae]
MFPLSLLATFSALILTVAQAQQQPAQPAIVYDGRAPLNYNGAALDANTAPYSVFVVRGGGRPPSNYVSFSSTPPPTILWSNCKTIEQTIAVKVDNTSVFVPGDNPANSQFGFRRTEILAQNKDVTTMESGTTVFHVSVMRDESKPLNASHQYQFAFLEVPSGSTPFSIPATSPASANANDIQILDFSNKVIFSIPFPSNSWVNLAVQVDWDALTLAVFASKGAFPLKPVTPLLPNVGAPSGAGGKGEFHVGLLKYPIANPKDGDNAAKTPFFGIQEGPTDGLLLSGVFVEDAKTGVSAGYQQVLKRTT